MASVEWIVASPPPLPTVFALIKTDQWAMTAETTHEVVRLKVFQNSLLTLACVAGYPVLWRSQNEMGLPSQRRTYNPVLEKKEEFSVNTRNYSTSDIYETPVIDRYESILTIQNFTNATAGTYYCEAYRIEADGLKTTVDLGITPKPTHNPPIDAAELVQTGFDIVRPQPAHFFRYWATHLSASFIYTIPKNATVAQTIVAWGKTYPATAWELRQPQWGDNSTSYRAAVSEFLSLDVRLLSPYLGQTTFLIEKGSFFHESNYTLILQTRFQNETVAERSETFFLRLDTIDYSAEVAEKLTPLRSATLLTLGQMYEIRMYLPDFSFENARLIVHDAREQTDLAACMMTKIPFYRAKQTCGVMGLSSFNDSAVSILEVGVRILLNVTRACTLEIVVRDRNDSHQSSNVSLSPMLDVVALEPAIFGYDRVGAKLSAEPSNSMVFVNETLTLRCFTPKCHPFANLWCVNTCEWRPVKYKVDDPDFNPMADAQLINSNYSAHTRVADAYFASLKKDHTGLYACRLLTPSLRKEQYLQLPAAKVNVTVQDPVAPKFQDGRDFAIVKKSFKRGSTVPLLCKVAGLPEPRVAWTWKTEMDLDRKDHEIQDNNSTLEISRPGTYVCNATSKYGTTGRTFLVQYDEEMSYLPVVIAVPAAAVLLALIAFLIWWLKRRAVQASFKELAETLKNSLESVPVDDAAFLNDQTEFLQYDRQFEVNQSRFTVTAKLLGAGEFGYVYAGELISDDNAPENAQKIAVKLPKDSSNLQQYRALADELKIMSHIHPHVNVISLVGACTQNLEKRQLFVLTEFCENGSLKDYLIKNFMKFEGFEVNTVGQFLGATGAVDALLNYAYQAANGMAHLAAEKILHRDLALRNLLLTANHIVKISDFGMSRQNVADAIYKKHLSPDVPVPIFWMALESISNGQFTIKSDVWSFGIVLWEMYSCGKRPYPDRDPDVAFRCWLMEKEENRMGPPSIACDEIYQLMRQCWKKNPDSRPSFSECKRIISRILEHRSPSMYQSMAVNLSNAWLRIMPNTTRTDAIRTSGQSDNVDDGYIEDGGRGTTGDSLEKRSNESGVYAVALTARKPIDDKAKQQLEMQGIGPAAASVELEQHVEPYSRCSELEVPYSTWTTAVKSV